jgi:hypothetical protein
MRQAAWHGTLGKSRNKRDGRIADAVEQMRDVVQNSGGWTSAPESTIFSVFFPQPLLP